jgi:hypothetical protein
MLGIYYSIFVRENILMDLENFDEEVRCRL